MYNYPSVPHFSLLAFDLPILVSRTKRTAVRVTLVSNKIRWMKNLLSKYFGEMDGISIEYSKNPYPMALPFSSGYV